MSVPKFPKPEKGVERYEVLVWVGTDAGRPLPSGAYFMDSPTGSKREAIRRVRHFSVGLDKRPAYAFDRRTGKVIATNEGELGR